MRELPALITFDPTKEQEGYCIECGTITVYTPERAWHTASDWERRGQKHCVALLPLFGDYDPSYAKNGGELVYGLDSNPIFFMPYPTIRTECNND